jgi:undecaprenol kinase
MLNPKKLKFSLSNAWNGIRFLYNSQDNFRVHLFISLVVLILSIFLKISRFEWVIVLFVIGSVWILEAINTVFEKIFDLIESSYSQIVKIGKDVSAAAVLLSAIFSVLIGLAIFLPPIIKLFTK